MKMAVTESRRIEQTRCRWSRLDIRGVCDCVVCICTLVAVAVAHIVVVAVNQYQWYDVYYRSAGGGTTRDTFMVHDQCCGWKNRAMDLRQHHKRQTDSFDGQTEEAMSHRFGGKAPRHLILLLLSLICLRCIK